MNKVTVLEYERMSEIFRYDPDTGKIYWKQSYHRSKIGTEAGSINKAGYITIKMQGKQYSAARIGYLLTFGSIPTNLQIDHIDRNRTNNKIENLRLVSASENCRNRSVKGAEPLGYTITKSGKYQAQPRGDYLGVFADLDQCLSAISAYYAARSMK